jgi:metal-sulfur cluster biosynthetic enzyme
MDQNTADVTHAEAATDGGAQAAGTAGTDTEDVLEALRDVVDPELGVNVVDLGLVYGVAIGEDGAATIDMTLTSAACPLTDVIEDQAAAALEGIVPGCEGIDPPLLPLRRHVHPAGAGRASCHRRPPPPGAVDSVIMRLVQPDVHLSHDHEERGPGARCGDRLRR